MERFKVLTPVCSEKRNSFKAGMGRKKKEPSTCSLLIGQRKSRLSLTSHKTVSYPLNVERRPPACGIGGLYVPCTGKGPFLAYCWCDPVGAISRLLAHWDFSYYSYWPIHSQSKHEHIKSFQYSKTLLD